MTQTIFHTGVNDFCRTYFVDTGRLLSPIDLAEGPKRGKAVDAEIFEEFLLFDRISFKVHGENLVAPFLLPILGERGLDALLDQDAIGFTLWTPSVTYMVSDTPGIDPLQYGNLSSPAHSDPEQSVDLGFRFMPALDRSLRRRLARELSRRYEMPRSTLAEEAVQLTNSSFRSGKLRLLGLPEDVTDLRSLDLDARRLLCSCATELLEYSYLLESGKTSYARPRFYSLFQHSVCRLDAARRISKNFHTIATLEGVPDLKALFHSTKIPFASLPRLRSRRSSIRFRDWLASASTDESAPDITRAYIEGLDAPKGFFETRIGKLTKSAFMTGIGAGAGALISRAEGAIGGATVAKALEPAVDFGLDLLDEFLLAGLTKGWSPRMFIKDLKGLTPPASPTS